jgi:arylsulfatase A-like enzyme
LPPILAVGLALGLASLSVGAQDFPGGRDKQKSAQLNVALSGNATSNQLVDRYVASSGRYMTDVLTDEAIGFIGRHRQQPFFLRLAYSAPHSPFQAPQKAVDKYLAKGFNRIVATTYAMIEIMDHGRGNVLQRLAEYGLDENTIVLFTSDNGPAFFNPPYMLEPGESTLNERFNCGYKGAKGYIEEGGIRVPMINSLSRPSSDRRSTMVL